VTATAAERQGTATAPSTWIANWAQQGSCKGSEPDALFVQGAAQHLAKKVCVGCLVIGECLADSLDNQTEFGIWGGMTERERRALLKSRPRIVSWRAIFETEHTRVRLRAS
jgi:WhiB family redox-sensing transcriptional regulator